ncbi:MAG: hypothetical protein LQ342_004093 [Letrouitia transgressa]|nr:MAG: hypothetical protein LQ342_004093 [Letrouitia transgressa]
MSSRRLGGGRILGNGKNLTPTVPTLPQRTASLLSPSASTASVDSSTSFSQQSTDTQDISSRISLENPNDTNGVAAGASSRLFCPICNEEMVTLLQLNRHLDDNHKNLEEVKQDEVKDWFKTQMVKAKRFQPLAVLNQKFKGLDVFESNEAPRSPNIRPTEVAQGRASPEPDEVIRRDHWQRRGVNDRCSDPACEKRLITANGSVNCRKCGRLFCDEHTMYQMKLSRSAQHEPVRGLWCRVCETCYKSREGYNDRNGFERDHTADFIKERRKTVDQTLLEVSRLEKRLTKLTQLLTTSVPEPLSSPGNLLWSFSGARNQRKQLEQSVVTWEEDTSVSRCPFCQQEFSSYTFRRHHCRSCGRVVCGDPLTDCSSEVGLNVATTIDNVTEKTKGEIGLDIRMCKDCRKTVFGRHDFAAALARRPADIRAYENLKQFERGIRIMLPKFQRLLQALQDPEKPPTPNQLAEASKTRKRLTDSFSQYNVAARRIRDMPTESPSQQRLQKAIFQQASNFLHVHMLPLKALPKILKHATPSDRFSPNGRPGGSLASIKLNDVDASSQASSSSAVSALEAEEKVLRERLIVLEEQSFLVREQIADASKRRKFDEVSSLSQNMEDLSKEIDQVQGQLGQLDFAGVYNGNGTQSALA